MAEFIFTALFGLANLALWWRVIQWRRAADARAKAAEWAALPGRIERARERFDDGFDGLGSEES